MGRGLEPPNLLSSLSVSQSLGGEKVRQKIFLLSVHFSCPSVLLYLDHGRRALVATVLRYSKQSSIAWRRSLMSMHKKLLGLNQAGNGGFLPSSPLLSFFLLLSSHPPFSSVRLCLSAPSWSLVVCYVRYIAGAHLNTHTHTHSHSVGLQYFFFVF